jgi:hypothetical protein
MVYCKSIELWNFKSHVSSLNLSEARISSEKYLKIQFLHDKGTLLFRYEGQSVKTMQYFMETESSLSCSKEPFIGPYSKPDQSSPYHPILTLYDPF